MDEDLGRYRPQGPSAVRLVWVFPDLLSTYGDRGNLLVLARRARLRGLPVEIAEVNSDQRVPVDGDIYLLGGGEDLPQILAARRLAAGRRAGRGRGPRRGDLRGLRRLPDHRDRVRRRGRRAGTRTRAARHPQWPG